MLQAISINNFKSIAQAHVPLQGTNILLGTNGSGKSNFIQAFTLTRNIIHSNFAGLEGQALTDLFYDPARPIGFTFHFPQGIYSLELIASADGELLIKSERTGPIHSPTLLGGNSRKPRLLDLLEDPGADPTCQQLARAVKSWVIAQFQVAGEHAPTKRFTPVKDDAYLRRHGSNIAAVLYHLSQRHPAAYQQVMYSLRLVFPAFQEFVLEPAVDDPSLIKLNWHARNSGRLFGPTAFSDGTLRFICLATLLLQPTLPALIIMDEPEMGLHPSAVQLLSELIASAGARTQVIFSTQSAQLLDQFQLSDVLVTDMSAGTSSFERLQLADYTHLLETYSLGQLWEANLLGARP